MVAGVIGKGLHIKGELHGEEDLVIEGSVEGTITMQKSLTIETGGRIKADIETENITVRGEMHGNLRARQKATIHEGGRLIGDVRAPRIEIEDGAYYKGNIDMPEAGKAAVVATAERRAR
jgi:cytoskeletal protein CcmA (bactofilin family)